MMEFDLTKTITLLKCGHMEDGRNVFGGRSDIVLEQPEYNNNDSIIVANIH